MEEGGTEASGMHLLVSANSPDAEDLAFAFRLVAAAASTGSAATRDSDRPPQDLRPMVDAPAPRGGTVRQAPREEWSGKDCVTMSGIYSVEGGRSRLNLHHCVSIVFGEFRSRYRVRSHRNHQIGQLSCGPAAALHDHSASITNEDRVTLDTAIWWLPEHLRHDDIDRWRRLENEVGRKPENDGQSQVQCGSRFPNARGGEDLNPSLWPAILTGPHTAVHYVMDTSSLGPPCCSTVFCRSKEPR